MSDITVELCPNRSAAEARKKAIKSLAPDADWKSRIVEDVATAALFLTSGSAPGSTIDLKGEAEASELGVEFGAMLVIWAE